MSQRPVQPIRPAATIIIVREASASFEIFMLKRTSKASFAGGMFVFPGGRVDGDDHLHKYDALRVGPTEPQQPQVQALGDEWRGFWVCAIRETFEESGLLLAYRDGELIDLADTEEQSRFEGYRAPLHKGAMTLLDLCETEQLQLAVDQVHFFNRFVTPLGRPRRFDTRFFIAAAPENQTGLHDDAETVDSLWITPGDALQRHAEGEFDLMNVTRMQLETLAQFDSKAALLDSARSQTQFPIRRPVLPVSN